VAKPIQTTIKIKLLPPGPRRMLRINKEFIAGKHPKACMLFTEDREQVPILCDAVNFLGKSRTESVPAGTVWCGIESKSAVVWVESHEAVEVVG
jgi:hypothetical protein